jgi:Family of unknown function (DUF5681)
MTRRPEKNRSRTGRFPRGVSGNPAGRPKGRRNNVTVEVRALAQKLLTDATYQDHLLKRLRAGNAGAIEVTLWAYAWGHPRDVEQLVEPSEEDDGNALIIDVREALKPGGMLERGAS